MADEPQRSIEVHIPSEFGYEKVAMEAGATIARRMGFAPNRIDDLKTAISEACINAMEHGNQLDVSTKVIVVMTIQESSLEVNVADSGREAFPPDPVHPGRPQDHRGWGMFLIENLMDKVQVSSVPQGGNQVRMTIYLDK